MKHYLGYGVLLIVIAILLCFRSCQDNTKSDLDERLTLEKTAKDTLRTDKNKETGKTETSKGAYVGSDEITKQFIQETDSELARLTKNSKAGITTKIVIKHDTTVVTVRDTVHDTRTADIITPYYQAHIVSGKDFTTHSIMMRDSVSYRLDEKTNRLIATHSLPPNMLQVTELNSFFIEKRQKKKNGKWIGGILIGAAAMFLIAK